MRAVYPGSFDPLTLGHLDIITRASKLFDEITVAVAENASKAPLLSVAERREIMTKALEHIPSLKIDSFQGLTVNYAKNNGISVLIRGLRAISDFEAELGMAQTNKQLFPELETIFLMSKAEYSFISSTTVKEVARLGGDVSQFVPPVVNSYLMEHYARGVHR